MREHLVIIRKYVVKLSFYLAWFKSQLNHSVTEQHGWYLSISIPALQRILKSVFTQTYKSIKPSDTVLLLTEHLKWHSWFQGYKLQHLKWL